MVLTVCNFKFDIQDGAIQTKKSFNIRERTDIQFDAFFKYFYGSVALRQKNRQVLFLGATEQFFLLCSRKQGHDLAFEELDNTFCQYDLVHGALLFRAVPQAGLVSNFLLAELPPLNVLLVINDRHFVLELCYTLLATLLVLGQLHEGLTPSVAPSARRVPFPSHLTD